MIDIVSESSFNEKMSSLVRALRNRRPSYHVTVDDMKSDTSLCSGEMLRTLGFYEMNDGGSTLYYIRAKTDSDVDNPITIFLQNDLVAEMIVENDRISMVQLGFKPNTSTQDCHDSISLYLKLCTRDSRKYELFFPAGTWLFSETDIHNGRKGVILTGVSSQVATDTRIGESTIMPYNENQEYIWNFGKSNTSTEIVGGNVVKNFTISTGNSRYIPYHKLFCKVGIKLTYCCYSEFDGIYFHYFRGNSLCIQVGWENKWGFMNFRCVGLIDKDFTYPAIWVRKHPVKTVASAVSANYWDYINFECSDGCLFYFEKGCNAVHNEINNIQVEWSMKRSVASGCTLIKDDMVPAWDDTSESIEHIYLIKGCCGGGNPLSINNISASSVGQCSFTLSWSDEDGTAHSRQIRESGIIGDEEQYNVESKGATRGTNIIIGSVSTVGDDSFPLFHSASHNYIRDTSVIVGVMTGCTKYPFMVANANYICTFMTGNQKKFSNIENINFKENNRFYFGSLCGTLANLCSLNDGSGLNNLVIRGKTANFTAYTDGTKEMIARLYLDYDSVDDITDQVVLTCNRYFDESKKVVSSWVKIQKSEIEDGTYPLKQWFDYKLNDCCQGEIPANTSVKTEYQLTTRNVYLDYFEKTDKIRKVSASALTSDIMLTYSEIGAILYCTDRKEDGSDNLGLLVIFDGTEWKTFKGTPLSKLLI